MGIPSSWSFILCLALVASIHGSNFCEAADPTDGFTRIPLIASNFKLQKPYNEPLDKRYSYVDGVPYGLDYSSGVWQFEGFTYVPSGTSAVNIMQIHGITEAETCLQLRIYNGDLWFLDYNTIEKNLYDKWFGVNVIHDVDEGKLMIYVNGVQKYETKDHGPGTFYFKCGVYAESGASHKMESKWKNINIYKE